LLIRELSKQLFLESYDPLPATDDFENWRKPIKPAINIAIEILKSGSSAISKESAGMMMEAMDSHGFKSYIQSDKSSSQKIVTRLKEIYDSDGNIDHIDIRLVSGDPFPKMITSEWGQTLSGTRRISCEDLIKTNGGSVTVIPESRGDYLKFSIGKDVFAIFGIDGGRSSSVKIDRGSKEGEFVIRPSTKADAISDQMPLIKLFK
jgi:hypothetical protein